MTSVSSCETSRCLCYVSSIPLAKNAMHSPSSIIYNYTRLMQAFVAGGGEPTGSEGVAQAKLDCWSLSPCLAWLVMSELQCT